VSLFFNVRIFDAGGAAPFAGEVHINGNRIEEAVHAPHKLATRTAQQHIDGCGRTFMPG